MVTSISGELAHALRFLASVVSQSFLAFGDILELHRKFLELSGGINRIFELDELLDTAQQGLCFFIFFVASVWNACSARPVFFNFRCFFTWFYFAEHDGSLSSTSDENHSEVSDDIISFSKVDIITPNQKTLARQLVCEIVPGKSLLVTG